MNEFELNSIKDLILELFNSKHINIVNLIASINKAGFITDTEMDGFVDQYIFAVNNFIDDDLLLYFYLNIKELRNIYITNTNIELFGQTFSIFNNCYILLTYYYTEIGKRSTYEI